jgi:7-keto-8-aminopelargonate synthetase-like enzyme|tara:strand:+ start:421 stop:567 length:147 start_codon:yes stop_codon:yes gene_type:complete
MRKNMSFMLVITSPQGVNIATAKDGEVLGFCANNYLGLANQVLKAFIK